MHTRRADAQQVAGTETPEWAPLAGSAARFLDSA
jgi:hypothetical protein